MLRQIWGKASHVCPGFTLLQVLLYGHCSYWSSPLDKDISLPLRKPESFLNRREREKIPKGMKMRRHGMVILRQLMTKGRMGEEGDQKQKCRKEN